MEICSQISPLRTSSLDVNVKKYIDEVNFLGQNTTTGTQMPVAVF